MTSTDCPVRGCSNSRGRGKLTCLSCWRRLPRALQRRVYAAWDDGDGYGTPEYSAVVDEALDMLALREARP